jgi:hypothetical protein
LFCALEKASLELLGEYRHRGDVIESAAFRSSIELNGQPAPSLD